MGREDPELDFSFVLASSVHDMKNSLGMLLNTLADVMHEYPPQNDAHAKSYAVLEYEAARINSELIQLLSLYRLDHDKVRAHIDECIVADVLSEQVARNYALLQTRAIDLVLECDEALTGYFDCDLVGGVINNILVNCARYSKSKLKLSAEKTPEGVCITIEDDGPGYPEHMLNASTFSETKGSFAGGRPHLGLMFANRVALMHKSKSQQGFIRLNNESSLGGGCFKLFLP
ncbi:sensor histidine kinase [Cellvibrio zantedeschiae]|uniref:histidine kinase n=1 Tax=Cellvibrio zantedeschiae TaxID=1237077 RepID=A0ABQ3B350_9GAMM|nr:HAMP domain-containing sensor histidine kinase [Cellvibrio zantedeschiae]GGY72609.1 sensor histidine kinase [Cellvibrio zantedeschiae]